jgi:hypothetical protein
MNIRLLRTSFLIRGVLAVFAAFVTLVLAAFIDGLSDRYANETTQLVLERTAIARF